MIDRREFLHTVAGVTGGLVVGVSIPACGRDAGTPGAVGTARFNAYVAVHETGEVVITAPCPEIGQGVRTSLPMIVAAELGARWSSCRFEQAAASDAYGAMTVGGSDSVADYWLPLRRAAAAAREMLISVAAARWAVDAADCYTSDGVIEHRPTGRRMPFARVAGTAADLPLPEDPILRSDSELAILGQPVGPVDTSDIVTGRAVYGHDIRLDQQLFVAVARAPGLSARLEGFRDADARGVDGVLDVVVSEGFRHRQLYGSVKPGVAVVARNTWAALRGRELLEVAWSSPATESWSTTQLRESMVAASGRAPDATLRSGNPASRSPYAIEASYELPMLAHVCMEPMNFTADVRGDGARLIGPTQNPRALQSLAAEALGLGPDSVAVEPTLSGGGFGRRLAYEYGVEAALLSRQLARPVQIVWSREDDVRHDFYRPPSMHTLSAGWTGNELRSWRHRLVTASLLEHTVTESSVPDPIFDVQGAADAPYLIPDFVFEYSAVDVPLRLGSWRSVSHSFNVFAVECFLDEVAHEMGRDPLDLRLELLSGRTSHEISLPLPGRRGSPAPDLRRLRRVLTEAAALGRWGSRRAPDLGRGIACSYYKDTYVAHVAEVRVVRGSPRVVRVAAAVDCGRVINPDGARAQVEGSVMDALNTVFNWGITVSDGRVVQSNFHDYAAARIGDAPEILTRFIQDGRHPSGMGEPPLPSVAPAVVNAIFAATGRRWRSLPIRG